jgi:hypothetical protein
VPLICLKHDRTPDMRPKIPETLDHWNQSLNTGIPLSGLIARNRTAYEWKAGYAPIIEGLTDLCAQI